MAGRGRGLTLPAWMTEGGLKPVEQSSIEVATPANGAEVAQQNPTPPVPQTVQTARVVPPALQPSGPRPPPHIPSFGAAFPSANQNVTYNTFPANGYPLPNQNPVGMMNHFIPPMGQLNNFMGVPQPFPNQPMIPNFVPPAPMSMHMGRSNVNPIVNVAPMPKAPPPPTVIGDPNNDVSCWAEHESEAGKKYWYNRVSLVSTYDKPFCLKSPEERSIPPCEWKEYASADGKKYYSNGKESVWTMPEEFRVWKDLVDRAEQNKLQQAVARATEVANTNLAASVAEAKNKGAAAARSVPAVVYSSPAEAAEAFKDMLSDLKVTTIAKMKEVMDMCQHDPRWDALKTQGEKKQALAEYQTKRLKIEKENQKLKARKQRDAFLVMLAENTDIDARTRWRDATTILQDDQRYKNVEDARDREDLFLEFIVELEKKEKEDKRRQREAAIAQFNKILAQFADDKKIDHKATWADSKRLFLDLIVRAEFRAMDDSDFRRSFEVFTAELKEAHKIAERKRKDEFEKVLSSCKNNLRAVLETAASCGRLTAETRWKEVLTMEEITKSSAFEAMQALFHDEEDKDHPRFSTACKEVLGPVQDKLYEQYRADRRLVKDILHSHNFKIKHDMTFPLFKAFALKVARVQECATDGEGVEQNDQSLQVIPVLEPVVLQEEGEEHDELPGENLKALLLERPAALSAVFAELHKKAVADHEEELQYARKVEKKFMALLADNFYKIEHADIAWDDAKRTLQRRSVYDELSKTDRKRLFAEHMESLRAPKSRSGSISGGGLAAVVEGPVPAPRRSESKDRRRQRSRSYSHSNRGRDREERDRSHGRRVVMEVERDGKRSSDYDRDDGHGKRARTNERR